MTNNMVAAKWIVSQVMRGTVRLMASLADAIVS